jgi:hypothetical protein
MDTFCCFRTNFYQSTRDHRGRDAPLGVAYLQVFSLSPLKLRGESTSRTNTKRFRPTETVKRHPTGITQCLVHLGLPTGATSRLHFPFRHLLPKKIPLRAVTVGLFFCLDGTAPRTSKRKRKFARWRQRNFLPAFFRQLSSTDRSSGVSIDA